jgi:5-methylcytosine-specific restriction endonuclease McrA
MQQQEDKRRGSAKERGYDYKWYRYSQWFLKQPGNQFCKIKGPRCKTLAKCVDHIQPPKSKDDPLFWDKNNHQAACIECNSWKGDRVK